MRKIYSKGWEGGVGGGVANLRNISGPVMITRYNMYPAAAINGNVTPGHKFRRRRST